MRDTNVIVGLKLINIRTKLSTVLCACTEKKTFGLEMLQIETEVATHTCSPQLIEKKPRTLGYRYHYFVNVSEIKVLPIRSLISNRISGWLKINTRTKSLDHKIIHAYSPVLR